MSAVSLMNPLITSFPSKNFVEAWDFWGVVNKIPRQLISSIDDDNILSFILPPQFGDVLLPNIYEINIIHLLSLKMHKEIATPVHTPFLLCRALMI